MPVAVLMLGTAVLTGCGQNESNVSTISVDKDGRISYLIYEDFSKDYYDLEELSDMASAEISEYNSEYISEKINLESVESVEKDDATFVKMVMDFDSADDFTVFNEKSLFYGTVEEARENGFTLSPSLVNDDGEKLPEDFLDEHADRHVIITDDKTRIITPFNIEYATKGVKLNGKKEAELADVTADTVQLLLSK
jgi:hypothetical protein